MAECLRCEQCQRVQPVPLTAGWYRVTVLGPVRSIDEPEDRHFCGRTCLGAYFAMQSHSITAT